MLLRRWRGVRLLCLLRRRSLALRLGLRRRSGLLLLRRRSGTLRLRLGSRSSLLLLRRRSSALGLRLRSRLLCGRRRHRLPLLRLDAALAVAAIVAIVTLLRLRRTRRRRSGLLGRRLLGGRRLSRRSLRCRGGLLRTRRLVCALAIGTLTVLTLTLSLIHI